MFGKSRMWAIGLIMIIALLAATSSVLAQDSATDTVEFTGEITSIDGDTLTVSGLTVDASAAEIKVTLEEGLLVKVEGTVLDDGTVQAREIDAASDADSGSDDTADEPSDQLEIVGTLESLGSDTAIVSGLEFDITTASLEAGLVEGDLVKVHASLSDDGTTWIAREIKRYDPDADGDMDDDSSDDMDDDGGDDSSHDDSSDDNSGACTVEIKVSSASLRAGPGTGYDTIGFLLEDDKLTVLEIDETGSWVKVATANGEGWVALSATEMYGDCSGLAVSDVPFADSHDDSSDDHSDDDSSDDGSHDDSHDDHGDDDSSHDDSHDDHGDDDSSHDDSHDDRGDD